MCLNLGCVVDASNQDMAVSVMVLDKVRRDQFGIWMWRKLIPPGQGLVLFYVGTSGLLHTSP